jgi:hypothetical protein
VIQKLDAPISVNLFFDHQKRQVIPKEIIWEGRTHEIVKIGLHHTYRLGRTLYHVFSACSSTSFFRLVLDTDNLFWRLEEVSDGLPD